VTLSRSPHAQIAGRVLHADGSPAAGVPLLLTNPDGSSFDTTESESDGSFTFDSLEAGDYVVGINLPGSPAWEIGGGAGAPGTAPKAALYYPAARQRSDAGIITLSTDEKRHSINFTIP